jgi:hypothetical protein
VFNLRFKVGAIAIGSAILYGMAIATTTMAGAASTPPGGLIKYWVTQSTPQTESITITGAIGDFGTVTTVDKNGSTDQNGNYALVTLQSGTFMVNLTSWNKKNARVSFSINSKSCSSEGSATGTVSLSNGTGRYEGISGHLSYTETDAWILPRTANGKCNDTNPLHYFAMQSGAGVVSF